MSGKAGRVEYTWIISPHRSRKATRKAIKAHRLKLKRMLRRTNRSFQELDLPVVKYTVHYQVHEPRERVLRSSEPALARWPWQ